MRTVPGTSGFETAWLPARSTIRVGTAGWSIPSAHTDLIPTIARGGSHLERYSGVLACAEINSTFRRPHRASTYARWVCSTPADFRFSVKVPKAITHECGLAPTFEQMQSFINEAGNLGAKLGPVLFQFPPRQGFEARCARAFFRLFRDIYPKGYGVVEARHPGWFSAEAGRVLEEFCMARVVADPPRSSAAEHSSGYTGLTYYRLHGSPRIYYSSYSGAWLQELATHLCRYDDRSEVWCIFDNTASGAAFENALTLTDNLKR